jgi:FKBP-type peptidyl-prolyl cis-trans isomerase 2
MQKEKISAIILVVIVVVALFAYIATTENLFGNLFEPESEEVDLGDCVDLYYIGKFANGTIFDSSYEDPINKTNGTLFKVYVTKNSTSSPPTDYEDYSSDMIEGFIDGLIGLKEGKWETIKDIPPEKAYGNKPKIGDTFNTQQIMMNAYDPNKSMNITVEVTNLNSEYLSLRWINVEEFDKFTMPEGILNDLNSIDQNDWIILVPPYSIWANSTEIIEIKNDSIIVKTTPTKTENITDEIKPIQYGDIVTFVFPDATTVNYDNNTVTINNNPEIGKSYEYIISYYGQEIITNVTVEGIDVTNDTLNISMSYEGSEKEYQEFNKTISFDRLYTINRNFKDIPLNYAEMLFEQDLLQQKHSSLNKLAGETLTFEVIIQKIYKTSES